MKRVIITGASGFIAVALIDKLLSQGIEKIFAVVKDVSKLSLLPDDPRIVPVVLSMDRYCFLGDYISCADTFFSFAWEGTRGSLRLDEQIQRLNFEYSLRAIDCAFSLGCRQFVLIGSQAEYGCNNEYGFSPLLTEYDCASPDCFYGTYKLRFYQAVKGKYAHRGANIKEARLFSVYGRGDYEGSFINQMLASLCSNTDVFVKEPFRLWDFMFVSDCAEALCLLAFSECDPGVYNIVSGDCRPLLCFVYEMKDILGSSGYIDFDKNSCTKLQGRCLSGAKLKRACGFTAKVPFSEGILHL